MKTETRIEYVTRDSILKLVTDDEVARVSNAGAARYSTASDNRGARCARTKPSSSTGSVGSCPLPADWSASRIARRDLSSSERAIREIRTSAR